MRHLTKTLFIIVSLLCSTISVGATFTAKKVIDVITIDGKADEKSWQNSTWYPLNQLMVGTMPTAQDFTGKFTLRWDENYLYLQAVITDDVLIDSHADPLLQYWDDDCLEVFLDEDHSGGDHQYNFNAFAYHVALDNQAVDIAGQNKDGSPQFELFNSHVKSYWRRSSQAPHDIIWELAISLHTDKYTHLPEGNNGASDNHRAKLFSGKKIGFMLAYCDNDGSKTRESFMGSTQIMPVNGDKNLGYKDASVFDTLLLIK